MANPSTGPSKKFSKKFFELNGQGGAHVISEDEANKSTKIIWVQLTVNAAKSYFKQLGNVPSMISSMLTAKATRPRTMVYCNSLVGFFRGVNMNKGSAPEDMITIRLWLHENRIITIQRTKSVTLEDLERLFVADAGPKNTAEFLGDFLTIITSKTSEATAKLGDTLDEFESSLADRYGASDHESLNDMQRRVILLRRYLIPQRDAIAHIPVNKISWLNSENTPELREITDTNQRIIEDLDAERDRCRAIYDALVFKAQDAINQKMYLLSIIAVIFMPLSFVAGAFGMNVGGIPGLTYKHGFLIVCSAMVLVLIFQVIILKMKKWL